jgi:hypothetical protein
MFEELLLADLAVVDLSLDNPNVWYELGVRHALRARGIIQIKCKRDHMPFDEPTFLHNSVTFAGNVWCDRFHKVKKNPNTKLYIMPEELGMLPKGIDAYTRNNLWQLYTALAWNPEKVQFICLWDRKEGDGPGDTKDMYDRVLKHFGQVYILDTNELFKKEDML